MLSSTIRSFSPSLQRRRRPVSTTSRRFKTLSVWLSILTVLNDLHHPAQGGLRRTRTVISKRFAKKQQMQWSRRGAHLLLQTRTRTLDGSLRAAFEHWYPGMMNDNSWDQSRATA